LFAAHGLHGKSPQRSYGAYAFTDRHAFTSQPSDQCELTR
jgi:hypothetical protein